MSDKQHLQEAVAEYKKAAKEAEDRLNKAVEQVNSSRQEQAELQSRPS